MWVGDTTFFVSRFPTVLFSSSALDATTTFAPEKRKRHLVLNSLSLSLSLLLTWLIRIMFAHWWLGPKIPRLEPRDRQALRVHRRRPRRRSRIHPFSCQLVHETPSGRSSLWPPEKRRFLSRFRSSYCVQLNNEHALPPAHRNPLTRALVFNFRLLLTKHDTAFSIHVCV